VTGDLTLHGVTRSLTFPVTRREGHYRGTVSIRQRDFGIQPISIVGGTVKVKDELRIEFDIVDRVERRPRAESDGNRLETLIDEGRQFGD
jgi:hypothetical protein